VATLVGLAVNPAEALHESDASLEQVTRLHSIFPAIGVNILGVVAVVGLLSVISNVGGLFSTHRVALRVILGTSYLCIVVLTRNRTSLVLLAVGVGVLLALSHRSRLATALMIPAGAALLFTGYQWYSPQIATYVHRGQTGTEFASLTGRVPLWSEAIEQWSESPALGRGYYAGHRLGSYADRFTDIEVVNIDNAWVETMLDVGLIGLIPLLLFALTGVSSAWTRDARSLPYGPFVAATVTVCAISSLVNPSIETMTFSLVIFGLTLLLPIQSEVRALRPSHPKFDREGSDG
jgi:O-antigen ligase